MDLKHSEQEFELIAKAIEEFEKEDYSSCLQIIDQLLAEQSGPSSSLTKLRHNRAVVEFYKSDCKNHGELLKQLNELDTIESDHTRASTTTTTTTLGLCSSSSPIVMYNKAIIYYHRHMYRTALEILTPLTTKLDALEQSIAARVGILVLRLLLANNEVTRALAFLEYFQTQLGLSVHTTVVSGGSGGGGVGAAVGGTEHELVGSDWSRTKLQGFERAFNMLYILINMLNGKVITVVEDGSAEFAALKAHQFYLLKDFQMAAKQLMKISGEKYMEGGNDELNTCIANNMGVIHLRVRHYALAAKFFQQAIAFDKTVAANIRNAPLHQMSMARSCEILYNLGISMLYLRRPKEAFQCFLVPLKSYHSNPRLWLRIAEACIMDQEMKTLEEEKKPFVASVTNFGARRLYVLKPTPKQTFFSSGQSAAVPEPTLEFAALCLRNALTLTQFYKNHFYETKDDAADDESTHWNATYDNNFCTPSRPISKESLQTMLSAIYAAYSYVCLRLGDYVIALEMANELLAAETLSDAHKMLGHMYAGEALINMDKLAEAKPHLEPTFISSLNAFDFETKDWQVKSLDAAQNIVRYNLAIAMTLQGDFDMAESLLNTCTHTIVATRIAALQMFINIKMGKIV